jgi:hypothetical protein
VHSCSSATSGSAPVWAGLFPETAEPGQAVRTFRSRTLSAQEAGSVFERWVVESFRLSGAESHPPYTVAMSHRSDAREQIDGMVITGWQGFLLESKFWPGKKVDFGPIALLHLRVAQRPPNTMGLMFAPFDYTDAAIESASRLQPLCVVLFDMGDLELAIEGRNMMEVVKRKWRLAVQFGLPHLPAL